MKPVKLNTGATMPAIGFGTWQITPDSKVKEMVTAALQAGYRLIDTARIYGNEHGVGEAIQESGIPRDQLFVTTKLWNDDQGYDRTIKACQDSLQRLGLEYLDLYLIHWPATKKRHDSWQAMEQLKQDCLIRAAGVSNYTVEHIKQLIERSDMLPAVNQVEFHPFIYEQQKNLLDYCHEQGIVVEAYSPINRVSSDSGQSIQAVAKQIGKTPQQVALKWAIQHGTVPLPRSTNPTHIKTNFELDFDLSESDMRKLDSLSDGERVTWDPAGMG